MSSRSDETERRIGRGLKLRDLQFLLTVAETGSMARAAAALAVTQPAVSQAIADLERFMGVRLLDRGPRGATLTAYGEALAHRGRAALDALVLGKRDIDFLASPGRGVVSVGADMSFIASGLMAEIILEVRKRHPLIEIQVVETTTRTTMPDFRELRRREVDLILGRLSREPIDTELDVELLHEERALAVAGRNHPLAGRPQITWEELARQTWILASTDNLARSVVEDAFRQREIAPPKPAITTYSMHLRLQLLASGSYVTVMPDAAFLHAAARWRLKALPIAFDRRLPLAVITLKDRTLTAAAKVFFEAARKTVVRASQAAT